MWRLTALGVLPMLLVAAELRIDHVTAAGRSLRRLQAALSSLGIRSEYGGTHGNRATEMAIASFPDGSYLELIALERDADPKMAARHPWAAFIGADAGPCAWAVRSSDLAAEMKRLQGAGITVAAATRGGRQRPDGVRLEWETAQAGPGQGTFLPFLIRDLTPRADRAWPRGKPSAPDFSGVAKVVIAVKDLDRAAKQFEQAYGLPAPLKQADPAFGAQLAWFDGTPAVLATPLSKQSWLAARLDRLGEAPCAFVLAARDAGAYAVHSKTRWFGKEVSWFDPEKLGWRLGFE